MNNIIGSSTVLSQISLADTVENHALFWNLKKPATPGVIQELQVFKVISSFSPKTNNRAKLFLFFVVFALASVRILNVVVAVTHGFHGT